MPCHRKVCWGRVDLDEWLGYTVPRDVIIKDGYVGSAFYVGYLAGIIMLFIKFYGFDRAYMAQGTVGGVARIQPLAPYPEWSSATLGLQQPYCTPGSLEQAPASNTSDVTIFPLAVQGRDYPMGMYTYKGKAVPNPIYPCLALDDRWAVANPLETSSLFVPTRVVMYQEAAPYCSLTGTHTNGTRTVSNTTSVSCTYTASTKSSYYIPDVEAYTLKLDHQLLVPNLEPPFVMGKDAMSLGALVDANGNAVDPCAFYARRNPNAPCPKNSASQASRNAYISIGQKGVPDIVSIGSLLEAAGVSSLEALGDPLSSDSMRYGGITLVLSVVYNNYWAPLATSESASRQVKYSYKVEAVQGKVKGIFGVSPTGAIPTTSRYIFEKSGLRVLMVFNGKIGQPDFTTTFVNLMTIFTTYTLGALVASYVIKNLLKFSPIYSQYITLATHDLSHLRGEQTEVKSILQSFSSNRHVLYPPPALLARHGQGGAASPTDQGEGGTTLPALPTALHLGIPSEPSATGGSKDGVPEAATESSSTAAAPLSAEQVSLSTAEGAATATATAPEPASAAVAGSAEHAGAPSGAAAPAKEGGQKSGQYADL